MKNFEEFEELQLYAELEGSEMGELHGALCQVYPYRPYMSEKLAAALDDELQEALAWYRENCKIVEEEEVTVRKISRLEFLEEE